MVLLSPYYSSGDPSLIGQQLKISTMAGVEPLPLEVLDQYLHDKLVMAIIFGVRIGAATVSAIILALIARNRRTPVFVLNQMSLTFFIINSGLYLAYLMGPFNKISSNFTLSYSQITITDVNISLACGIFQLVTVVTIECSLMLQGLAVFPNFTFASKLALSGLLLITLPTVGVWFASTIMNSTNIVDPSNQAFENHPKIPTVAQLLFAISIVLCSLIFVGKLFFAIRLRRVLGLKQFGPLHIVFIMGAQTMVVPAVMTILNASLDDGAPYGFSALCSLFVVVFLPLSAMWASSVNTDPVPTSTGSLRISSSKRSSISYKSTSSQATAALASPSASIPDHGMNTFAAVNQFDMNHSRNLEKTLPTGSHVAVSKYQDLFSDNDNDDVYDYNKVIGFEEVHPTRFSNTQVDSQPGNQHDDVEKQISEKEDSER